MFATKACQLVAYKDFTHGLDIPNARRGSRPQLYASFAQIEREISAIVPEGSVLNPDLVQFGLGRLRLEMKERIDACSKHLRGLDMHEILHVATEYAIGGQRKLTGLPYSGDAPPHAFGVATTVDSSLLKLDGLNPQNEPHQRAYPGNGLSEERASSEFLACDP